ncbi:MAG: hypothetical protein AAF194_05445, partial [Pseudomonadota bacterium]
QSDLMIDLFIECGIAGINVSHVRHEIGADESQFHNAGLNVEYSLLRCVVGEEDAKVLGARVAQSAADSGLQDVCLFRQPVVDTATYVPGSNEYRKHDAA